MAEIIENPLLFGVVGHPVKHSLSPQIHQAFATKAHLLLQYHSIDIEPNDFTTSVEMYKRQGYRGFNVTVPFKETAYQFANKKSERAKIAGSVNLLSFQQNDVMGDNVDGIGFIRDLMSNQKFSLKDKRILILGAGGAVRGIVFPILEQKPAYLHIANRTIEKAQRIAEKFKKYGSISISNLNQIPKQHFDLIINATSFGVASIDNIFPEHLFSKESCFYDLFYNIETTTPFLTLAKQHGATHLIDGLGMLVEQAAESFFIWHHIRPETDNVIRKLKNKEI